MADIPLIPSYPLPADEDLPERVVPWVVDPARAVLLIHDMQRYFLRPFAPELAEPLTKNVAVLREYCRATGVPIAYTAQPGRMSDVDRGLLKDFWGTGMRGDAADREIVDALTPGPSDWLLTKWRYSAFQRTDLLERMRAHGRNQLIICGVYAHVGVLMTAVDAFTHDIQPFLVADAVADFTAEDHRMALDYAARCCAAVVATSEVAT